MVVYAWTHLLQCIVVVRSFLKMLKLCKIAVSANFISGAGSYSVSRCVRTWIKFTPGYPVASLNLLEFYNENIICHIFINYTGIEKWNLKAFCK